MLNVRRGLFPSNGNTTNGTSEITAFLKAEQDKRWENFAKKWGINPTKDEPASKKWEVVAVSNNPEELDLSNNNLTRSDFAIPSPGM